MSLCRGLILMRNKGFLHSQRYYLYPPKHIMLKPLFSVTCACTSTPVNNYVNEAAHELGMVKDLSKKFEVKEGIKWSIFVGGYEILCMHAWWLASLQFNELLSFAHLHARYQ